MLTILGYKYCVKAIQPRSEIGAMGRCDTDKQIIQLANDQGDDQFVSTILHEAIEAINIHLDLGIDHPTIQRVEAGLFQFLTCNGVSLQPLVDRVDEILPKKD